MSMCGWCHRYDPQLEGVLRHRRRLGRYMPAMKVIPPGLDFSSLKVDLPEDPAIKEMEQMKPAFNARTTSPHSFQTNDAFGDTGKGADAMPLTFRLGGHSVIHACVCAPSACSVVVV